MALQKPAAVVLRQPCTAMKRVENERREAHEEVPGKIHTINLDTRAPRDFHVHERERNRYTCPPLEHFVEKAVAGVVVPVAVSSEAFLVEQVGVQYIDGRLRFPRILKASACHQPLVRGGSHRIELVEIWRRIERRALELRDHQRG